MYKTYSENEEITRIIFDAATQRVIDLVLEKVLDELPDEYDQQFVDEIKQAVLSGVTEGIDEEFDYKEFCSSGKKYIIKFAEMYLENTLAHVANNITSNEANTVIEQVRQIINMQGIPVFLDDDAVAVDLVLDEIIQNSINETASTIVDYAVEKVLEQLPDEFSKKDFTSRLNQIIKAGININATDNADYSVFAVQGIDIGVMVADEYLKIALMATVDKMEPGPAKSIVNSFVTRIANHGVKGIFDEQEQEVLQQELTDLAVTEAQNLVTEQSIRIVNSAVDYVADKAKDKSTRGKNSIF